MKTRKVLISILLWSIMMTGCAIQNEMNAESREEEPVTRQQAEFEIFVDYRSEMEYLKQRNLDRRYQDAMEAMSRLDWDTAMELLQKLSNYPGAAGKLVEVENAIKQNTYGKAEQMETQGRFMEAADLFASLDEYSDSAQRLQACYYQEGERQEQLGNMGAAAVFFGKADGFLDARQRSLALWDQVADRQMFSAEGCITTAVLHNGTPALTPVTDTAREVEYVRPDFLQADVIAISGKLCLLRDGTVLYPWTYLEASNYDATSQWTDIVAINGDRGIRIDGMVVSLKGYPTYEPLDGWYDVIAISGTSGLRADGTILLDGAFGDQIPDPEKWTDVIKVDGDTMLLCALRKDGRVYGYGLLLKRTGAFDPETGLIYGWEHMVDIAVGSDHIVGLREDGTVVAIGSNDYGQCAVEEWTDIIDIDAGSCHTVGMKSDGTLVAVGASEEVLNWDLPHIFQSQCEVDGWVCKLLT